MISLLRLKKQLQRFFRSAAIYFLLLGSALAQFDPALVNTPPTSPEYAAAPPFKCTFSKGDVAIALGDSEWNVAQLESVGLSQVARSAIEDVLKATGCFTVASKADHKLSITIAEVSQRQSKTGAFLKMIGRGDANIVTLTVIAAVSGSKWNKESSGRSQVEILLLNKMSYMARDLANGTTYSGPERTTAYAVPLKAALENALRGID